MLRSTTTIRGAKATCVSVALTALLVSVPTIASSQALPGAPGVSSSCGATVTVQPGDTYFRIAQRCGVTVDQIARANPEVEPTRLQIGQTLRLDPLASEPQFDLPPPVVPPPQAAPEAAPEAAPSPQLDLGAFLGSTIQRFLDDPDADPFARGLADQLLQPRQPEQPEQPEPDEPAPVQITGVLTEEGVECPTMRSHDGQLFSLLGSLGGFGPGDVVQVQGRIPEFSFCQQGITIEIYEISGL